MIEKIFKHSHDEKNFVVVDYDVQKKKTETRFNSLLHQETSKEMSTWMVGQDVLTHIFSLLAWRDHLDLCLVSRDTRRVAHLPIAAPAIVNLHEHFVGRHTRDPFPRLHTHDYTDCFVDVISSWRRPRLAESLADTSFWSIRTRVLDLGHVVLSQVAFARMIALMKHSLVHLCLDMSRVYDVSGLAHVSRFRKLTVYAVCASSTGLWGADVLDTLEELMVPVEYAVRDGFVTQLPPRLIALYIISCVDTDPTIADVDMCLPWEAMCVRLAPRLTVLGMSRVFQLSEPVVQTIRRHLPSLRTLLCTTTTNFSADLPPRLTRLEVNFAAPTLDVIARRAPSLDTLVYNCDFMRTRIADVAHLTMLTSLALLNPRDIDLDDFVWALLCDKLTSLCSPRRELRQLTTFRPTHVLPRRSLLITAVYSVARGSSVTGVVDATRNSAPVGDFAHIARCNVSRHAFYSRS
jgi:hypothetical protein